MLRAYKSDHIQLLPKMENLLKKDKLFARVVLWTLTEIKGPISFNLLNKLTYVMYMTKKFERDEGSEITKLPGTNSFEEAAQFTVRERTCESEAMQSMGKQTYPNSVRESIPTLETQGDKAASIQEENKEGEQVAEVKIEVSVEGEEGKQEDIREEKKEGQEEPSAFEEVKMEKQQTTSEFKKSVLDSSRPTRTKDKEEIELFI